MEARQVAVDDAGAELVALDADVGIVPVLPGGGELREMWPTLTVPERRQLLALGIDAVMLRAGRGLVLDDRVWIFWRGQGPDDLPTGARVPLASFVWPV